MVKAMPTENLTLRLRAAVRGSIFATASAVLILTASITTNAAIQEAAADDWTSSIFSAYGITIMLVLVLVGLFVYKHARSRKSTARPADARVPKRAEKSDK